MPEFLRATIDVLLGIGLLFGGGELFVQGSVALALVFGIPQLVIGLTVVALGTSAPELFVSLSSVRDVAPTRRIPHSRVSCTLVRTYSRLACSSKASSGRYHWCT